jgi:hypothetical protein
VKDDIVACVLLLYNPETKCPLHVHAYRLDSDLTANALNDQLQVRFWKNATATFRPPLISIFADSDKETGESEAVRRARIKVSINYIHFPSSFVSQNSFDRKIEKRN